MKAEDIILTPPVKGHWAIFNPPGHPSDAYDFLAVDDRKSPYRRSFARHLFLSIGIAETYAWESPVFCPVDGVVAQSHGEAEDRKNISMIFDLFRLFLAKPKESAGFQAFGGNYLLIEAENCFVLMCHLKKGSLAVRNGDSVKAGQLAGMVGNSGMSLQPHLHMQVMSSPEFFPLFANLMPFRLNSAQVRSDGAWRLESDIGLENGKEYIF